MLHAKVIDLEKEKIKPENMIKKWTQREIVSTRMPF